MQPAVSQATPRVYDRGALTYSNTFDSPIKRNIIKTIEWCSGKIHIIRMIRKFEKRGKYHGQSFWRGALDVMGIDLITPQEQLDRIPKTGPVVIVANHPHGMVDGMVMADLIGRVRTDYRILTRAFLTDIDEDAGNFLIPVPFPHEKDAQAKMVEMRKAAMAHLKEGGVIAIFPSGVVASSNSLFGPMVEDEWNLFTAKMIRMSGARVVPLFFPGANSRWYQMANQVSATLRQSLLIHEIVNACGRPQKPVVGHPFDEDEVKERLKDQRACMDWMREETLNLKE
ncbi:lysophospholipid acyltransferase family protein [Yoonia sp. F2084L]|uniref:lysophospholipid acyltransferase family protein n=1 Tax=Yoonia sp. F2084L TaxID=2926419 RepID=UPI001FF6AA19|nr:lysophospholipid acyltransferase family protein [Yoonia sp. F2084L]